MSRVRPHCVSQKIDDCGEGDGGEEEMGASVGLGGDAAPVAEAGEYDLDAVTLKGERGVVGDGVLARARWGTGAAMPRSARAARAEGNACRAVKRSPS